MPSVFAVLIKYIRDLPFRSTPLDSDMIPCASEDGGTYRTTRGAIRAELTAPAAHAASHITGSDQVGTTTPAVSSIPKTPVDSTKLDPWISLATTATPGLAQLAVNGQSDSGVVVQGNDARLGNITLGVAQFLGPAYLDLQETSIASVGSPSAGHRRLYVDNSTGRIAVKKEGGSIGELENDVGSVQVELTAGGTSTAETLRPGAGIVTTDEGDLVTEISLGAHVHAAADITSGVIAIARLATGTPDGTKFIRDDGTLAVPSNTPSVQHVQRINATQNKTSNFTLTDADSFSLFTNLGATGEVQAQLQASPASGSVFFFFVAATQSFTILPGSGHSIKIGPGLSTISMVGSVIGCFCVLVYTGGGVWSGVTSGTWIFSAGD